LLIRLCGEQGELVRATLRRDKALKLALPTSPGRPYSSEEKARMLEEAKKLRTPQMHAALALDQNTGLRDRPAINGGSGGRDGLPANQRQNTDNIQNAP
jgi:hypothetical protein